MGSETIGKQIAMLRKEKGVKQEEVASYVGVSAQAVSKWENGGVPDVDKTSTKAKTESPNTRRKSAKTDRDIQARCLTAALPTWESGT